MKFPGSLGDMLAQAQKVQQTLSEIQANLEKQRVEGSAGGGMVTVTVDGAMHVLSVVIDPSLLVSPDREMLQDLISAAANDALHKAKEMMKTEFSKLTGGIPLPGFAGLS